MVPRDGTALPGMPDIELLGILKLMCEVVEDQLAGNMFDYQTIQPSSGYSYKANTGQQIKPDNVDIDNANSSMPSYFMSSINRSADKRESQILTQKIHGEFSDFLFRNWVL